MTNNLQIAQWYAAKASKAAAQGDMAKARDCWQTALERFEEYHHGKPQEIEDVA